MDDDGVRNSITLIVALTAMEAMEYALYRKLGDAWRFIVEPNDFLRKYPAGYKIAFGGNWRERRDLALLRRRAEAQGFKVPR
jgi:hypothetical protein